MPDPIEWVVQIAFGNQELLYQKIAGAGCCFQGRRRGPGLAFRRSGDVDQIPPFQAGRLVVSSSPPRGTPVSGLDLVGWGAPWGEQKIVPGGGRNYATADPFGYTCRFQRE